MTATWTMEMWRRRQMDCFILTRIASSSAVPMGALTDDDNANAT